MHQILKYLIGFIYSASFVIALVSIGVYFAQKYYFGIKDRVDAKLGILSYHGMYGGMITCNIFNLFFATQPIQQTVFILVVFANGYLYWNMESLNPVKECRKILTN